MENPAKKSKLCNQEINYKKANVYDETNPVKRHKSDESTITELDKMSIIMQEHHNYIS